MLYKKYLAIMLVVVLVITSFVSISSAHLKLLSNEKDNLIEDRGRIECYSLSNRVNDERGIYYIVGETGTKFAGRLFTKYVPINIDDFPDFKKEGLKVEFTGKISIKHMLSIRGIYCLRLQALPIELKTIKEIDDEPDEVKLSFDIGVKEKNKIMDPIPARAVLTNKGKCTVNVSEMGLEVLTLDFTINTPDGKNLSFNQSRRERRGPKVVTLEPGKTNSTVIEDISIPGLFIDEKGNNYTFIEGDYKICGHYFSGEYRPGATEVEVFECEMRSSDHPFKISTEEPENMPPVSIPGGPYSGYVDEEITFNGSASYDLDGSIVEWDWSYTNGASFPTNVGDEKVITFIFTHTGIFNLSLRVVDDKGAEDIAYAKVTITEEPAPEKAKIQGTVKQYIFLTLPVSIPIDEATVSVRPKASGASEIIYETTTDSEGCYELEVDAGHYNVSVSKIGYEPKTKEIKVEEGEKKQLDFVLKKKSVDLKFEIILESDAYKVGKAIPVTAKLTNNGETAVRLSEMSMECQSLDFFVLTPDLKKIHYIGPVVKGYPEVIELGAGESHTVKIDITNAELGNGDGVYDFSQTGRYVVLGFYHSKGDFTNINAAWRGALRSQVESFAIRG